MVTYVQQGRHGVDGILSDRDYILGNKTLFENADTKMAQNLKAHSKMKGHQNFHYEVMINYTKHGIAGVQEQLDERGYVISH